MSKKANKPVREKANIKTKPSDIILLTLLSYIVLLLESPIRRFFNDHMTFLGGFALSLIFYAFCVILFIAYSYIIVRVSKSSCNFNIIYKSGFLKKQNLIITIVLTIASVAMFLFGYSGLETLKEGFSSLKNFTLTIGLYSFYIAKSIVFVVFISLAQKFCDMVFKSKCNYIPYGGLFLSLIWVLLNIYMGAYKAIPYSTFNGILYGLVFVFSEKKPLISLPFISIITISMFISM